MLQSRLDIETPEVISDPQRGRICDPLNRLLDSTVPSASPIHSPSEVMPASTVLSGPTQEILERQFGSLKWKRQRTA